MIYAVTPPEHLKRADRRNLFVVAAASAAAAKARCAALNADVEGTFDGWNAIALTDTSAQDFTVECSHPVGVKDGNAWPRLTSGGSPLAI